MRIADLGGGIARAIARGSVQFYYPNIAVTGRERIPATGPVLLCANHANSLLDPPLLGIAAGRPVSFLAKAPLFDVPFFGDVLRALGMIPAYRGRDDGRRDMVVKNLESLAHAARQLAAGRAVGIFPEGLSHDEPQVQQVRSGAARLALQAVALGAKDLVLVPVGLNFEAKERFCSSVWVNVGEPLAVADYAPAEEAGEKRAVRELTAELDRRLKRCALHLDEPAWAPLLPEIAGLAGETLAPTASTRGSWRLNLRVAAALNYFRTHAPERTAALADRLFAWQRTLRAAGLPDSFFLQKAFHGQEQRRREAAAAGQPDSGLPQPPGGWGLASLVGIFAVGSVLAGAVFALLGIVLNLVPFALTRLIAPRFTAPGKTTVAFWRLLTGLPLYLLWYGLLWWWLRDKLRPGQAVVFTAWVPLLGLFALAYVRRVREGLPSWLAQIRFMASRERWAALAAERLELRALLQQLADDYRAAAGTSAQPAP